MPGNVVPSGDELKLALRSVREENPTLGIAKTQALLLTLNPSWTVSEKRVRKVLQSEGLTSAPSGGASAKKIWPASKVNDKLDIGQFSKKIEVRYFDKVKGKGLIAKEDIGEREIIWKEDPFIVAPEWEIYDLQMSSQHCGQCTSRLAPDSSLVTPCSSSTSATPCSFRYCNRLCLNRSRSTHPLLCPAQNPASVPLLAFARKSEWQAVHALAQCTSRILLDQQQGRDDDLESDWEVVKGLAMLGMQERFVDAGREPDQATWNKCYQLYFQTFCEPKSAADQKKLARIMKKPLDPEIEKHFFDYDAFLCGLGRMSLNLEAHGGLYTLHSHLNHSCTPNTSVRHTDQRTALSRITVIAISAIPAGEELLIAYVNPEAGVNERRKGLLEWGFGVCRCRRCIEEAKYVKRNNGAETLAMGADGDLERELKAGLGVM